MGMAGSMEDGAFTRNYCLNQFHRRTRPVFLSSAPSGSAECQFGQSPGRLHFLIQINGRRRGGR